MSTAFSAKAVIQSNQRISNRRLVFEENGKPEYPTEKNLSEQSRESACDAKSGNRTQAQLVLYTLGQYCVVCLIFTLLQRFFLRILRFYRLIKVVN